MIFDHLVRIALFTVAALVVLGCTRDRNQKSFQDVSISSIYAQKFVKGFNSGDAEYFAEIINELYTENFLENNGGALAYATDRLELLRTYGPLDYNFTDSTATPVISWYQGKVSNGWVGYQFHLAGTKAEKLSTWRARPVPWPKFPQTEKTVRDSFELYLKQLTDTGLFSGSATISHRGQILFNESFGTDKKNPPNSIDTITRFHTASVTKLFTAVLALQLIEEGLLSLEDPIGKYIPEYPEPYQSRVKILHLLNHTSGIKLNDDVGFLKKINSAENVENLLTEQIVAIQKKEPAFEPGTEYNYTSEGFDLLGAVIERVTKKSWKELIENKIFKPANMKNSRVNTPLKEGNYAIGKTSLTAGFENSDTGPLKNALDILPKRAKPSSGIWSNAYELHLFMQTILTNELLGKEWTDQLLSIDRITFELPKYEIVSWVGLGIQGEKLWGTQTLGHGGVVPGYSSLIEYLPDNEWLLTVTSNAGEASAFLVFQRFLELVGSY